MMRTSWIFIYCVFSFFSSCLAFHLAIKLTWHLFCTPFYLRRLLCFYCPFSGGILIFFSFFCCRVSNTAAAANIQHLAHSSQVLHIKHTWQSSEWTRTHSNGPATGIQIFHGCLLSFANFLYGEEILVLSWPPPSSALVGGSPIISNIAVIVMESLSFPVWVGLTVCLPKDSADSKNNDRQVLFSIFVSFRKVLLCFDILSKEIFQCCCVAWHFISIHFFDLKLWTRHWLLLGFVCQMSVSVSCSCCCCCQQLVHIRDN